MAAEETPADAPTQLLGELLAVVPRLVERTRSQAEFARSVASFLPCVGPLVARPHVDHGAGVPEHERIDVLSVLADDDHGGTAGAESVEPVVDVEPVIATAPTATVTAPAESELPIQDYDSLAASQVVPRLATLAPEDLRAVQAYESATRRRQTILHRVAQLLAD
jgi:hypothetical protein